MLCCLQVLRWLLAAQGFEQFLSRKFPASKRFGLEGCEALLPGLLALVESGAQAGLKRVSLPHDDSLLQHQLAICYATRQYAALGGLSVAVLVWNRCSRPPACLQSISLVEP